MPSWDIKFYTYIYRKKIRGIEFIVNLPYKVYVKFYFYVEKNA